MISYGGDNSKASNCTALDESEAGRAKLWRHAVYTYHTLVALTCNDVGFLAVSSLAHGAGTELLA